MAAKVSEAAFQNVLDLIEDGMSLSDACAQDGMPGRRTVTTKIEADEEYRRKYARATSIRADRIFEEMLDIADDGTNDWAERSRADGSTYTELDHEHVQRSKLRIDARKWVLAKMNPKKYGDKVEVSGPGENGEHGVNVSFDVSRLSTATLAEIIAASDAPKPE